MYIYIYLHGFCNTLNKGSKPALRNFPHHRSRVPYLLHPSFQKPPCITASIQQWLKKSHGWIWSFPTGQQIWHIYIYNMHMYSSTSFGTKISISTCACNSERAQFLLKMLKPSKLLGVSTSQIYYDYNIYIYLMENPANPNEHRTKPTRRPCHFTPKSQGDSPYSDPTKN